jgi:hypothetical protein
MYLNRLDFLEAAVYVCADSFLFIDYMVSVLTCYANVIDGDCKLHGTVPSLEKEYERIISIVVSNVACCFMSDATELPSLSLSSLLLNTTRTLKVA